MYKVLELMNQYFTTKRGVGWIGF